MGGALWQGIPTPEIESVSRILAVDLDLDLLDSVRAIERGALAVLNAAKESPADG